MKSRQIHYDDAAIDRYQLHICCIIDQVYFMHFNILFNFVNGSIFLIRLLNRDYTEEENAAMDEQEEDGFLKAFKVFFVPW